MCGTDIDDDDEDNNDFLSCTREWVNKVNRGGLHLVTDETFLLFKAMELTVRHYLIGTSISIEEAIEDVRDNEDVLSCWSLITSDVEDEIKDFLLHEMAKLWITIRG